MAKFDKEKRDVKTINVDQVVSYLNHTFAETVREVFGPRAKSQRTSDLGVHVEGTALYWAQTEFCYLIDEIQRGPTYMLPKVIGYANNFISSMKDVKNQEESA